MSGDFSDVPASDILEFSSEYPLAWVVPAADPSTALLMPLLIETDAAGQPASVLGHLPKRSEATAVLRRDGSVVFLFLGANAYIPPAWVSKQGWAPTWNFLSLKIRASETSIDAALTRPAVEALVDHMETRRGSGWTVGQIGPRYDDLLNAIIGFRSPVHSIEPRFKVAQDETNEARDEIRQALGDHPLAGWME